MAAVALWSLPPPSLGSRDDLITASALSPQPSVLSPQPSALSPQPSALSPLLSSLTPALPISLSSACCSCEKTRLLSHSCCWGAYTSATAAGCLPLQLLRGACLCSCCGDVCLCSWQSTAGEGRNKEGEYESKGGWESRGGRWISVALQGELSHAFAILPHHGREPSAAHGGDLSHSCQLPHRLVKPLPQTTPAAGRSRLALVYRCYWLPCLPG